MLGLQHSLDQRLSAMCTMPMFCKDNLYKPHNFLQRGSTSFLSGHDLIAKFQGSTSLIPLSAVWISLIGFVRGQRS